MLACNDRYINGLEMPVDNFGLLHCSQSESRFYVIRRKRKMTEVKSQGQMAPGKLKPEISSQFPMDLHLSFAAWYSCIIDIVIKLE